MNKLFYYILILLIFVSCSQEPEAPLVITPVEQEYILRGRELVYGLASCGLCHGSTADPQSPLVGGRLLHDKYGEVHAPNLTPDKTGLKDWSANDIMKAIRSSIGKDGQELSSSMHEGFEWMSDQDALSIVSYLKTLPPVANQVERRDISWFQRNTTGMFESRKAQVGYVASIDPKYVLEYGKYLYEHVARAKQCLAQLNDDEEENWFVRAIFGSGNDSAKLDVSFKDWNIDEIVHYLQTGEKPTNKLSGKDLDPRLCPIKFYRYASIEDLTALATYLKVR